MVRIVLVFGTESAYYRLEPVRGEVLKRIQRLEQGEGFTGGRRMNVDGLAHGAVPGAPEGE